MEIYTIPSETLLKRHYKNTPVEMRPNVLPNAVVARWALTSGECNDIRLALVGEEQYHANGCDAAFTVESPRPLPAALQHMQSLVEVLNMGNWGYDLDESPYAWMQTYGVNDHYEMHTDTYPGQNRKLSAVLQLSDPQEYSGGDLKLYTYPQPHIADRAQGSITIFQPWIMHEVSPLTDGWRQTINMGFYGPDFR